MRGITFLALVSSVVIPAVVVAKIQVGKIVVAQESKSVLNSQNMDLLIGYININPTNLGEAVLAIVDDTALSGSDGATLFVDTGKSGTGQVTVYTVRKGDTLGEIAEMHGVSANTIVWANDIVGGKIKEGQELVILPISGVRHTVKSGDTLQSIATKYKADLGDVLSYNNLSSASKIKAGDVIIVPDGRITAVSIARKSSGSSIPSAQITVTAGYYARPLSGGKKSQGIHGYNGIDLAAPTGTPVMASAQGTVTVSRSGGYSGGYGTYVVISHPNGTQTLYAHMGQNYVSTGQRVEQGQVIGAVGMTGRTTGPHLHFEVRGARNPF